MPIFALAVTALAGLWTIMVVFADSMRSAPQSSRTGGCSLAAIWLLAGGSWLIWFLR